MFYICIKVRYNNYTCYFIGAIPLRLVAHLHEGSGNISLKSVSCLGNESGLIDCPTSRLVDAACPNPKHAGVECIALESKS